MAHARLIVDPALPAATNMARDEALLGSACAAGRIALRFYRWRPPAVSLGYFQPIEQYDARADVPQLDVVRRLTGGGAILHDEELTYSLTAPAEAGGLDSAPLRLYEQVHAAIVEALRGVGVVARFHDAGAEGGAQRGPFFCFARRHRFDLLVGGDKIVGSAQRRRPGGVLQHGSIILRRVEPQPCTGVNDHAAAAVSAAELADALVEPLERHLNIQLRPDEYAGGELADARRLAARYASAEWTRQR